MFLCLVVYFARLRNFWGALLQFSSNLFGDKWSELNTLFLNTIQIV